MTLTVTWLTHHRKARNAPDPAFPQGIDVLSVPDPGCDGARTCRTELPWPAPECGLHIVKCSVCQLSIAVTAAGRPDDPRSITVFCRKAVH
jgi:hypothetical protein